MLVTGINARMIQGLEEEMSLSKITSAWQGQWMSNIVVELSI